MDNSNLIKIENLSYIRKGKYILHNINWTIKNGENWILFGPNGSGKTTLLKILTGYILPSEGNIIILGETIGRTNLPELRKRIGWISNSLEDLIHYEDTALEIVAAGLTASTRLWYKVTKDELDKARNLLRNFECEDIAMKPYGILSQGERQTVLIARSLINNPEMLIFDEPCAGLDLGMRESFLSLMEKINNLKNAPSIIFVTHHVEEITSIFNDLFVIKNGENYRIGKKNEILTSEQLSNLFGMNLEIIKKNNRFFSIVN